MLVKYFMRDSFFLLFLIYVLACKTHFFRMFVLFTLNIDKLVPIFFTQVF